MTQYKHLKLLIVAILLIIASFGLQAGHPGHVLADPVPTCGGGATLVPAAGNNPAYCSCPAGQVLVTGTTNTCAASCPAGSTTGTDSISGQGYCNPPGSTGTPGSTTGGSCASNGLVTQGDGSNTCVTSGSSDPAAAGCTASANCDLVGKYVNPLIDLLTALVGVVVTISIIIGGIQYSSSGGDPGKVTAAKNRIRNSLFGLVALIFLYTFLQFIVPGGIF